MRVTAKNIFGAMLLLAVLLISSHVLAREQSQVDQTSDAEQELVAPAPELAEIIPLATELSGRLAVLENKVTDVLDVAEVEGKYAEIEANLKAPADQIQRLKDSKDYRFKMLVELRQAVEQENELFEEISKPLSKAIGQLGTLREEWLAEKELWNGWQSSMLKEGELDQLKSTFAKAHGTIDTALNLILPKLEAMLTVQEKAATIQAQMNALSAELDGLMVVKKRSAMLDASPPMLSSRYFSQFGSTLWYAVREGLDAISWPDKRFIERLGWVVLLQVFLSLVLIIAIYRNRLVLKDSERWRFLAARPFSAGLFLGFMATVLFYEYGGAPLIWKFSNMIVGGISFARLIGGLVEGSWKRKFVYGLVIVLIVTRFMYVVGLPLPLFRLFTVLTALAGLFFCLRWAKESGPRKDSNLYTWSLRLGSLLFAVIMIAELWGKATLSYYLFVSLTYSIATVLVLMLFMYMIHGGLEWLFRSSPLRRVSVLKSEDTDAMIRREARFIDVVILGLVLLPALLVIWGVYDSLKGATEGLLALGFNLGSMRITVGLLIVSACIIYGSYLVSWILQKLFMDEALVRSRVDRGVRLSMARLVHYVIIFAGFLLAISTLGFEISKITIMLSALGVGIGFGLQGVVNNFVSGLILLFERPVRVGDTIEIGGKWAEIKRIGLRSTTVQTFDQADVIIPNGDMVNNQVTNWTLTDRQVRIHIPVGVAYGSDVPLVMETLMACATTNAKVTKTPAPQVLFLSFGESSLDFELRVWILDADDVIRAKSELHQEVDRRFREAKIEIAFPQRDLHLRSMDESVKLPPPETTG